jgi:hypothetical protein
MKRGRTTWTILAIFLTGLVSSVVMLLAQGSIFPDQILAAVKQLLTVYSVHLSVILGGIFAKKGLSAISPRSRTAIAAIALSVLWNALVLWGVAAFVFAPSGDAADPHKYDEMLKYLQTLPTDSGFLVSGLLTYLFVSAGAESSKHERASAA